MAAALKLLRSPEPEQAAPRKSRSGTYSITRVEPRAGASRPLDLLPRVRGGDLGTIAALAWFEQLSPLGLRVG